MLPTLAQYHTFHSMVCFPSTARQCCGSFQQSGGTIMFMPAGTHPALSDSTTRLSPLTYYMLVVISLTGLSTLLGMTDFVDIREIEDKKDQTVVISEKGVIGSSTGEEEIALSPLLRSVRDPSISVSVDALKYVAKQSNVDDLSDFSLVRRFEYDFRLVGLNVIMIHLTSPAKSKGGPTPLHLIEVYDFRISALRLVSKILLSCFEAIWPCVDFFLAAIGLGNAPSSCRDDGKAKNA